MKNLRLLIFPLSLIWAIYGWSTDPLTLYERKAYTRSGDTLLYRIMYPQNYDPSGEYPLVVFLHGAGERGEDNTRQLTHGARTFSDPQVRENYPSIVLFPQCPSEGMWSRRIKYRENGRWIFEFPVEEQPNRDMSMVIGLVREVIRDEAVDPGRIYLAGLSMGGIGVFEFCYYAPDLAAAGVSLAGGHDPNLVSDYGEETAFWLFHGTRDGVVPHRYSRELYEAMSLLGYDVQFTSAEGRGHEWDYALKDPGLMPWLFRQSR